MPTLSPNARTLLRQHLTENFSQAELEELAFDLGLDAETLLRETKSEFARALILYFEDRDETERLAREVLARRPDPVLKRDLENIEAPATAAPPAAPVSIPQPQAATSRAGLVISAALLALAVLAVAHTRHCRNGHFNICGYADNCVWAFTPAVAGDYYVVVYGMRPSAVYDLTVRDR